MKKPNIIFILVDDLGWAEPGCYGNSFNETPNIDNLAESGVCFTQAYASATVCSPSRAGLLTGQAPPRNGITDYLRPWSDWFLPLNSGPHDFADNELPEDTNFRMDTQLITMAQMFRKCGYATGIIGKWHLSGYDKDGVKYGPSNYGFDEVLLSEQRGIGSGSYFHPYKKVDPTIKPKLGKNEYLVDRMNYEAVEYIKRHKDEPFFLYLSHYAVHTTLDAKKEDIEYFSKKRETLEKKTKKDEKEKEKKKKTKRTRKYLKFFITLIDLLNPLKIRSFAKNKKKWTEENNPVLAAMIKSIDDGVGEIVEILKELDLYETTMIVFTSDNGGDPWVTQNAHLSAGKSFTYEGGLRVPQIISYPKIMNSNVTTDIPTINLDFYPTFADIIGYDIPEDYELDGTSLLPLLKGERDTSSFSGRLLSWHYPLKRRHFLGGRSSAANRKDKYKYIWFFNEGISELYNLEQDESESINLADKLPEKAKEHRTSMREWLKEVGGKIPKRQEGP
ncbi:MAG: sulfatase [Promethearchaeia archaeon]